MATKSYNLASFYATVNGVSYSFFCSTTNTRNGFCHHVYSYGPDMHTRISYFNRTWERFDYETALKRHFEKFGKELNQALTVAIVDRENARITGELAKWQADFEKFAENLAKVREARPGAFNNVEVTNQADAAAVLAVVNLEAATL